MDVCLMIEGQEGVTWDQWMSLAETCEAGGFGGLFRSDHYLSFGHPGERGSLDAWATLSALASRTRTIRLGTLVSPVTFRHPAELAKAVATADHASGGRVELGLGAGWFEQEHQAYGFPFPPVGERMEMLEEQAEIIRGLWTEESMTFEGRHYRLEACPGLPKPVQPRVPIIVGGSAGPRSARLAARWADEYNVNFVGPDECRRRRASLDAACESAGRDPASLPLSLMTMTLVGADRADLRRRAERQMAWDSGQERGGPDAYLKSQEGNTLTGTPEEVVERLAAYAEAGVRRVMLQWLLHDDLEGVALIGEQVVPPAASL